MNRNKAIQIGVGILIIFLTHFGRSVVLDDDSISFAETIDYAGIITEVLELLDEVEEGTVRAVKFEDGAELKHSEKVELMGELDFTGLKGDMLILRKTDGKWVEIWRYVRSD